MDEMLKLLRENNEMLKEIIAFLKNYRDNDDIRQFSINVAADIFVEMLKNNKDLRDKITNNFKELWQIY